MTQYMLLFSLGPVQPFIAQARKTRDLWQGSFLLSTLMEAAMQGIDSSALVFPTEPAIKDNIPDLPNKYIAIFNTEQQASNTALKSKQQIEACWQSICEDVWKEIIEKHARFRTEQTRRIWERQTSPAHCFEIYWVIVEGDSSPEHYQQWLQKTQAALDARKRFRNFLPQDEPGEKSTISGIREALRGSGVTRQDVQMFWRDLAQHLSAKDISQDGTERLDAIDTVKRFAVQSNFFQKKNFKADFPSTSSVATASFVVRLLQTQIDPSVLDKWLQATNAPLDSMQPETIPYLYNLAKEDSTLLKILKRDGDCFFPETFTPRRLYKDYGLPSNAPGTQQRAEQCHKATTAMLTAASQAGLSQPTPYYALLQMDGDHMGTLLSGVHDREEHKAISAQLSHFAREDVPRLVQKKHPARLVYAGGDDVLAFSPLEELFKLADELQQTYCEQLRNIVSDEERKKQVTASMGIVIAHHYTPLSLVVRAARQAETLAKNRYGRNALVVTVMRRSGEQTRVGCHWHYDSLTSTPEAQPIALFSRFYELFKRDALSPKCLYILLEEAPTLLGLERAAQSSEIKRVLRRQRADDQKDQLPDDQIQHLADNITRLAEAMDNEHNGKERATELHADQLRYGLVETLGWLLVAEFLTRKGQHE